jgi:hypothetical protein
MIEPNDEALFRRRYRGPQCEGNLAYAKRLACEYAELHAAGMPSWVQAGVAALHFRHVSMMDVGEKQLLRISIDVLLAVGRACSDESKHA